MPARRPNLRRPGTGAMSIFGRAGLAPNAAASADSTEPPPSHCPSTRSAIPASVTYNAMSARSPMMDSGPPPSTSQPNFAGKAPTRRSSDNARPSASARVRASVPASGPTMMFRAASVAGSGSSRPRRSSASWSPGRPSSRNPRICRLARRVRSIWPLPRRSAISASPLACARLNAPHHGRTRAISPSPLSIGRSAPGHQPFTSKVATRLMSRPRRNCGASSKGHVPGPRRADR